MSRTMDNEPRSEAGSPRSPKKEKRKSVENKEARYFTTSLKDVSAEGPLPLACMLLCGNCYYASLARARYKTFNNKDEVVKPGDMTSWWKLGCWQCCLECNPLCNICCCCGCLWSRCKKAKWRGEMRKKYNIQQPSMDAMFKSGNFFDDLMVHLFCGPCASNQEDRETRLQHNQANDVLLTFIEANPTIVAAPEEKSME